MEVFNSLQDEELIKLILKGTVGVMPTDTIYGVTTIAKNPQAVARLYKLKERENKPGTIIAASILQLVNLGLDAQFVRGLGAYWPGPTSVIIPAGPKLAYLHQGVGSIAARIPDNKAIRELLVKTGPLLTSSANQPGELPANNFDMAQAYFGDQVDFYVDGGDMSGRQPSTIIRVETDGRIIILRQGAAVINEKENII